MMQTLQRPVFFRLIQCNVSWKVVPWITLLFAFLAIVSLKETVWAACVLVGTCVGMMGSFRMNPFLSSLPFEGRSIFLVRLTTTMALLWCPAIAATVVTLVSHAWIGSAVHFEFLILAGFYTALFLFAYAIRIEMVYGYAPIPAVCMLLGFAGILVVWPPPVPTAIVETLVIALLLIRVWKTVPRSFQLVPRPPLSESCPWLPPTLWPSRLPLVSFIWGWRNVWILPVLAILCFGIGPKALLPNMLFIAVAWGMFESRERWLRTLPISSRRLLLMFILPVLAAVVVGESFSLWSSSRTVQMRIVGAAGVAGFTLFQCIFHCMVSPSVYRTGFVRLRFAALVGGWVVCIAALQGSIFPVDAWIGALVRASSPVSGFPLLIIAIAILALLYVALEWVFAGSVLWNFSAFRQEPATSRSDRDTRPFG
jgi:hypothetical protein